MPRSEDEVSEIEFLLATRVLRELRNYNDWIFDEMEPFLGQSIAEVGGGIGIFTEMILSNHLANNPDASLEVFEPSKYLYPELLEVVRSKNRDLMDRGRLRLIPGYFDAMPEKFDTVVMINVLEHINNDSKIVRSVYESLRTGGFFVIYTPALEWLYGSLDKSAGHYRRYSKASLEKLVSQCGFRTIVSKYMDLLGIFPWLLQSARVRMNFVLGGFQSVNPRLTRFYDAFVVPTTRAIESLGINLFGKNIITIVKKEK